MLVPTSLKQIFGYKEAVLDCRQQCVLDEISKTTAPTMVIHAKDLYDTIPRKYSGSWHFEYAVNDRVLDYFAGAVQARSFIQIFNTGVQLSLLLGQLMMIGSCSYFCRTSSGQGRNSTSLSTTTPPNRAEGSASSSSTAPVAAAAAPPLKNEWSLRQQRNGEASSLPCGMRP